MPPKPTETTGLENESKYRAGRGTGLPQGMVLVRQSKKKENYFKETLYYSFC